MQEQTKKQTTIENVGLLVQSIAVLFVAVYTIIGLIEPEFFKAAKGVIVLTLLILAFNNEKIYKRKFMTLVYILFSILVFTSLFIG